ncbi:type II toxin-antitoxin system HicB family antitoxin [Terribacillus saccharophilus]|uniref:type II toxin-antitoxin system HicB family antitoxin n=1 Tax=Terribacillus saccharophilus TaxID=361277 RepID=UPI003981FB23
MAVYKYYSLVDWSVEDNVYLVSFPDIENCFTFGDTLSKAIDMAKDALGSILAVEEEQGRYIPKPSPARMIKIPEGASLIHIVVDTKDYE